MGYETRSNLPPLKSHITLNIFIVYLRHFRLVANSQPFHAEIVFENSTFKKKYRCVKMLFLSKGAF